MPSHQVSITLTASKGGGVTLQNNSPLFAIRAKEEQVDPIILLLQEKHQDCFSGPQLRLWARMNVNRQHEYLDIPTNIPIFTGSFKVI